MKKALFCASCGEETNFDPTVLCEGCQSEADAQVDKIRADRDRWQPIAGELAEALQACVPPTGPASKKRSAALAHYHVAKGE